MENRKPHFLIFAQHTLDSPTRSGVQRVVTQASRALASCATVDFVKWDAKEGQLGYLGGEELDRIFSGERIPGVAPNSHGSRSRYRFGDTLARPRDTWLLQPEIPFHLPNGNELFARMVSQCREYGAHSAAVFYDLIPIRDKDYGDIRPSHVEYVLELLRTDLVFAISRHSAMDLAAYYQSLDCFDARALDEISSRILPLPLGECSAGEPWRRATTAGEGGVPMIMMLGTVEPRKQQTRFLRILNELRSREPALADFDVELFGSLHPASDAALRTEMARNPHIHFRDYSSDADITAAFGRAWFSAFPSVNEGYGLPIMESLRHGVPCLAADFGSMAEVASGGGCHLVDMRSDEAIADGLIALATDRGLRSRLRGEIAGRRARSWEDYADAMATECMRAAAGARERLESESRRFVSDASSAKPGTILHCTIADAEWGAVLLDAEDLGSLEAARKLPRADRVRATRSTLVVLRGSTDAIAAMPPDAAGAAADADVLALPSASGIGAIVDAANRCGYSGLLPSRIAAGTGEAAADALVRQVMEAVEEGARKRDTAWRERLLGTMASVLAGRGELRAPGLSIVISTYNRGPFVEANVEWALQRIAESGHDVSLVVVDNASTDDTAERLSRFVSRPGFHYHRNPVNVGMLGNLWVCSTLQLARHVWLTGDDDYAIPGAIERVFDVLVRHPRIPLIVQNFGIYLRPEFREGETPADYLKELVPLAPKPSPTMIAPVNRVAEENDNLFTAIYPLVFRSDLLAACFNYPFDGIPFDNLVESVPTTKLILETLSHCDACWLDREGIIGNLHSSWQHHRPRWHLVLMAQAFDQARRAGVNEAKLWDWAKLHYRLYLEGVDIARERGTPAHLEAPKDFDFALRIYRRCVEAPEGVRLWKGR